MYQNFIVGINPPYLHSWLSNHSLEEFHEDDIDDTDIASLRQEQ